MALPSPAGYPPPRLALLASSREHERPRPLSGGTGTLPAGSTPSTVALRPSTFAHASARCDGHRRRLVPLSVILAGDGWRSPARSSVGLHVVPSGAVLSDAYQ